MPHGHATISCPEIDSIKRPQSRKSGHLEQLSLIHAGLPSIRILADLRFFIHQSRKPVSIASQFVSLDDRREIQHVTPTVGNKRTAILSEPDAIYCYTIVPSERVDASIIEQAIVTLIFRLLFGIVVVEWLQVIQAQRLVEWFVSLHVRKVTQSDGDHSDCPGSSSASFFVAESDHDDHTQDQRACALRVLRKRPFRAHERG